jgi:primosomal protein N' (replication factor Y)
MILRIAVPAPLYRSFDYLAPPRVDPTSLRPGIRVRVPFGHSSRVGIVVELCNETTVPAEALRSALEVLDTEPVLDGNSMRLAQWAQRYYHHPPGEVFAASLPVILRHGRPAQASVERVWRLADAGRAALETGALLRAPRQRELLEYLSQQPEGVSDGSLRREFPGSARILRILCDKGWLETGGPRSRARAPAKSPPALNGPQARAVACVTEALGKFDAFLVDGVTGSGKTEVYLRIAEAVLTLGRQALVLVPEIGLTPQLLARFHARLPGPLAVLHSGLGDRERLDAWLLARSGAASVVIGTRSAVFVPLRAPGIIIVDEEHDTSFKQQDGFRYNGRDLAVVRARQANVPVLLGSATPALESLHNVERRRYRLLRLPERVGNAVPPTIELLDVRRQPMEEGLSAPLCMRMKTHLDAGEQVLLFLNRRGFAPTLICHECGWLSQCRRCDARMTLHMGRRRLICHHCGAEQPVAVACPECGSVDLRALGQGTERIEQVLERRFPGVGIARVDRDSTRRRGSLDDLLRAVQVGERRILVGTQMLAKGHHFPDVTLVGIVDADQGLFGADFRASERMAQLILQVAGRAGRAERPGRVLIQTHHPQHPLLSMLIGEGYSAFANSALAERRHAGLPPYTFQALLRAEAARQESPLGFLREAAATGHALTLGVELLGPVPAPMERRAGRYRAQLLIQAQRRRDLHGFLDHWVERLQGLKSARRVRWSLDVDPVDLL